MLESLSALTLRSLLLNATHFTAGHRRGLQAGAAITACMTSLPDMMALLRLQQAGDTAGLTALLCTTAPCRTYLESQMAGSLPAGMSASQLVSCTCEDPAMAALMAQAAAGTESLNGVAQLCSSTVCRPVMTSYLTASWPKNSGSTPRWSPRGRA